jgi:hypothetical protein
MAHKRKSKRRHAGGRKFDPNARRHRSTRRGRKGLDDRDYGSPQLRARKLATTTREDVELTARLPVLFNVHLGSIRLLSLLMNKC